jgi:DNA-binding CsgD family transcriptional regulator
VAPHRPGGQGRRAPRHRRPRHAQCDAQQLTPSERRVELAAGGRTNREIANELFVTVKAVEWRLRIVYRKLDVRGREALQARLGPNAGVAP